MNSIDFKDESAVKEYIDRIGVEFRFQCFTEDRADGCHRLADWIEFAKKDFFKAGRVYKHNCDLHQYGHSCHKYGVYAFLGKGMTNKRLPEAADYYKKGCLSLDHPHAPACVNMGLMIQEGAHEVEDDVMESRKYFERGCDLGDADSCGNALVTCLKKGAVDESRAFHFAKRGCELKDYRSCRILSDMYRRGMGIIEANPQLAEETEERAKEILSETTETRPNVTFGQ